MAALVAAQAARHLATSVVHGPQQIVGPHTSRSIGEVTVQHTIIDFHQDEAQEWVADVECTNLLWTDLVSV